MHAIRIAIAALMFAFASPVFAQDCAGFTDVAASDPFCANVEWLKNRDVTRGCTPATSFCPGDAVPRLQMAAFMNRLATALTPAVVRVEAVGGATDLSSAPVLCQTPGQLIEDFPRTYVLWATITALGTPNEDLSVQVVRAANGGAFAPTNQLATTLSLRIAVSNNATLIGSPLPVAGAELDVGSSYQFGLRVARTGAGTANLASFHCHLMLEVRNRQGGASPFDPR